MLCNTNTAHHLGARFETMALFPRVWTLVSFSGARLGNNDAPTSVAPASPVRLTLVRRALPPSAWAACAVSGAGGRGARRPAKARGGGGGGRRARGGSLARGGRCADLGAAQRVGLRLHGQPRVGLSGLGPGLRARADAAAWLSVCADAHPARGDRPSKGAIKRCLESPAYGTAIDLINIHITLLLICDVSKCGIEMSRLLGHYNFLFMPSGDNRSLFAKIWFVLHNCDN